MFDRHFQRINFVSPARVMSGDEYFEAMTENISLGGMFMRTDKPMPVGKRVSIDLTIPSTSLTNLTLRGEVVRNHPGGVAFQFKSVDFETFSKLKAVMKRHPLTH